MRILRSIVAPSTALMAFGKSKLTGCSPIRTQVIGDELVWDKAVFLQKLAHQFERRPLIPPRLDENVENFTLGIHDTPKIDQATTDFQIDLIEMPVGMRLRPAFAKIGRDLGSKMVHPAPRVKFSTFSSKPGGTVRSDQPDGAVAPGIRSGEQGRISDRGRS